MKRLQGRAALVTGASSGIGWAAAKALAAEGASLALAARRQEKLEVLASEIADGGGEAVLIPTDVRDRQQVERMVERAWEHFGRLDVLVNNAGVAHWEPAGILDGDPEYWTEELETNLLALMVGTRAAARRMARQGSGHIVNVSSLAGRFPPVGYPGYGSSKWGVTGFTEAARREFGEHGIRVTLIEPGEVATPMQPEWNQAQRKLEPEDVADAVVYALTRSERVLVNDIQIVAMPDR